MDSMIQGIAIYALPVILAITLHEAAHGYAAKHFGDNTAELEGRISLNPMRHVDPIGTVVVPLTMFIVSKLTLGAGFLFGWAKPVPVNFENLNRPKRDMLWVAVAGPAANLFMALCWALVIKLGLAMPESDFVKPMILMGIAGIKINVLLMVLNLLPLPPLDGGRMMVSLLPQRMGYYFAHIEPYGLIILLVLLFSGVLGAVIWPIMAEINKIIVLFFGLYI